MERHTGQWQVRTLTNSMVRTYSNPGCRCLPRILCRIFGDSLSPCWAAFFRSILPSRVCPDCQRARPRLCSAFGSPAATLRRRSSISFAGLPASE
jgi:hypothetical protein